jgi:hypothetical protein
MTEDVQSTYVEDLAGLCIIRKQLDDGFLGIRICLQFCSPSTPNTTLFCGVGCGLESRVVLCSEMGLKKILFCLKFFQAVYSCIFCP